MTVSYRSSLIAGLGLACGFGPAHATPTAASAVYDPAEPVNRAIFAVNQTLDHIVLKPVARTYTLAPQPVRTSVHNFMVNVHSPVVFINDVLQLNLARAAVTVGRFGVNSTLGVGGLFDVADRFGWTAHEADLGQTLGRWGVGAGSQIQLPIMGPSNLRDTVGLVAGGFMDPLTYVRGSAATDVRIGLGVTGVIDGRSRALPVTDRLERQPDYYVAMRTMAAMRRTELVAQARTGATTPRQAPPEANPQ